MSYVAAPQCGALSAMTKLDLDWNSKRVVEVVYAKHQKSLFDTSTKQTHHFIAPPPIFQIPPPPVPHFADQACQDKVRLSVLR